MDKPTKDAIHDLVLKLRKTLEGEIERELGRYGIYADRAWLKAGELPRLSDKERDQDRPRIEAAIRREQDAGLAQAEAVRVFIRETAYTHMNRLLGMKCMEVRGLITETVTTRPIYSDRSQRHRDFLDEHPQAHREPDRGLVAMLQAAYAEASQHIGVVFDPESDYSLVWPRHTVLKEIIDWITGLDGEVAHKRGDESEAVSSVYADDTFLGWVYQYFQEEEKNRVFREVNRQKKKISGQDIIPATTAYTERYMVQFLVENSLGALWMEMHPDSDLCQSWEYFVEDPNLQTVPTGRSGSEDGTRQQGREPCPVAELTLLDPACGSGHFLLYAFDLFAQMYEAEAGMAGRPADQANIARRILRHNLYGIDIDLRSVQLSALNLYMKACTYAGVRLDELQNGGSVHMNLVCADIVLRRGPELKELLDRFKNDPLTQELVTTIWHGMENARELGSLLKVEEQVDAVIAHKREAERGTFWEHPEELWDQWKQDFLTTLKDYVDRAAESFDVNRHMFGQEAIKGVQFLDLLTRRYDVVATNPPYMNAGNISLDNKAYLQSIYRDSYRDLFAAFIERCVELTRLNGHTAMIVQQSFMFISSYAALRKKLLRGTRVRTLAHLGTGAFENIQGENVNTAMFALKHSKDVSAKSVFFRLLAYPDKRSALTNSVSMGADAFIVDQRDFAQFTSEVFAYWLPPTFLEAVKRANPLDSQDSASIATAREGLHPISPERFLRYWWEAPPLAIGSRWFPYMKGGAFKRWFGNQNFVVDWEAGGTRIKEQPNAIVPSEDLYFCEGLTYTKVSSKGFAVRYMPEGFIFSEGGHGIFSDDHLFFLLALCNSLLCNYYLNAVNTTINFQVGNVKQIPVILPSSPLDKAVFSEVAKACVELSQFLAQTDFTEIVFDQPLLTESVERDDNVSLVQVYRRGLERVEAHEVLILLYEAFINRLVLGLYSISEQDRHTIVAEEGFPPASLSLLADHNLALSGLLPEGEKYLASLPQITIDEWHSSYRSSHTHIFDLPPRKLLESELARLYVDEGRSLEEICATLELNPISVVALRRELGLINPADFKHEVENFLTHRIWELCKRDEDGIVPYDAGLGNPSLLEQVRGEIEAIFGAGRAVAIEAEMDEILGRGGLAHWLGNPFFQKHVRQFKKRPILWQLTSPEQKFRVLVYYHKLDHDTLPKIRSQYLWPLLERARTQLRAAQNVDPPDVKTIGDLEAYIADMEECDRHLESVIQGTVEVDLPEWAVGPYRNGQPPYDPDLDDGVKVNILPLQAAGLLPVKKVV